MQWIGSGAGLTALAGLCFVLFLEEAGVPLPFLPGDALLVGGGILVASGRTSALGFVASATASMVAGAVVAHAWARAVGRPVVDRVATRFGVKRHLDSATARLRSAGAVGVAVCRLIPGLRVYTNIAAGAADIPRRTFVLGAIPSVLAWVLGFGMLGVTAGRPIERLLVRTRHGAVVGVVIVAMALLIVSVARRLPARGSRPHQPASHGRIGAAVVVDLAIVTAAVAAIAEGLEGVLGTGDTAAWDALTLPVGVATLAYITISRRTAGITAGERLLGVSYRRQRDRGPRQIQRG